MKLLAWVALAPVLLGISFPEGFSARQMTDRVAAVRKIAITKRHVTPRSTAKAYAAALKTAKPPALFHAKKIEGFLFPSLYKFGPSDSAATLVKLQLAEFSNEWDKLGPIGADATPYEVLKVASMIEREAAVPSERPLVAAVIYNRLAAGMPLGIDATLRYGHGILGV